MPVASTSENSSGILLPPTAASLRSDVSLLAAIDLNSLQVSAQTKTAPPADFVTVLKQFSASKQSREPETSASVTSAPTATVELTTPTHSSQPKQEQAAIVQPVREPKLISDSTAPVKEKFSSTLDRLLTLQGKSNEQQLNRSVPLVGDRLQSDVNSNTVSPQPVTPRHLDQVPDEVIALANPALMMPLMPAPVPGAQNLNEPGVTGNAVVSEPDTKPVITVNIVPTPDSFTESGEVSHSVQSMNPDTGVKATVDPVTEPVQQGAVGTYSRKRTVVRFTDVTPVTVVASPVNLTPQMPQSTDNVNQAAVDAAPRQQPAEQLITSQPLSPSEAPALVATTILAVDGPSPAAAVTPESISRAPSRNRIHSSELTVDAGLSLMGGVPAVNIPVISEPAPESPPSANVVAPSLAAEGKGATETAPQVPSELSRELDVQPTDSIAATAIERSSGNVVTPHEASDNPTDTLVNVDAETEMPHQTISDSPGPVKIQPGVKQPHRSAISGRSDQLNQIIDRPRAFRTGEDPAALAEPAPSLSRTADGQVDVTDQLFTSLESFADAQQPIVSTVELPMTADRKTDSFAAPSINSAVAATQSAGATIVPPTTSVGFASNGESASPWSSTTLEQLTTTTMRHASLTEVGGQQRFQMRLDPPELGAVRIEIQRGADGLFQIHISADSPETRSILEGQADNISQSLNDQGMTLSQFDVSQHSDGSAERDHAADAEMMEEARLLSELRNPVGTAANSTSATEEHREINFMA